MKKILCVVNRTSFMPSANTLCVEKILSIYKEKGYTVDYLCLENFCDESQFVVYEKSTVKYLSNAATRIYHKLGKNFFSKTIVNLTKAFFKDSYTKEGLLSTISLDELDKYICSNIIKEDYSFMISVSLPFICHAIASRIKEKVPQIKWIAYELDPYEYNYTLKNKDLDTRKRIAQKTLKNADLVLSTYGIIKENEKFNYRPFYNEKAIIVELPNLINNNFDKYRENRYFKNEKINCVFTGRLYPDIRKPNIMLETFSGIENAVLHLYTEGCEKTLKKYKKIFKDRLILHGFVSSEEAKKVIANSNILINIGNSIPNQTPSKVFDYISSGKPIINFTDFSEDSSEKYFSKYRLNLTIRNDEDLKSKVDKIIDFIEKNKNSVISFDEAVIDLKNCLSHNICKRIVERIDCL